MGYSSQGVQGPTGKVGNKVPSGYKVGQIQNYTPEQMELFKHSFSHLGPESYLSRLAGGDQSLFGEIEAPALKQFSGIQGGLASRFSGQGLGGRKSSGFQNTMTSAAQDFAGQLQSQRQALQRQAINDLMGLSNQLLNQRPYQSFLYEKPQEQSPWGGIIGAGIGGLGGFALGGPAGGIMGAQMGYGIGNSFGGGGNYQIPSFNFGNFGGGGQYPQQMMNMQNSVLNSMI